MTLVCYMHCTMEKNILDEISDDYSQCNWWPWHSSFIKFSLLLLRAQDYFHSDHCTTVMTDLVYYLVCQLGTGGHTQKVIITIKTVWCLQKIHNTYVAHLMAIDATFALISLLLTGMMTIGYFTDMRDFISYIMYLDSGFL